MTLPLKNCRLILNVSMSDFNDDGGVDVDGDGDGGDGDFNGDDDDDEDEDR